MRYQVLPVPSDDDAYADLLDLLPTLHGREILACRTALRARVLDGTDYDACLLAVVARERGLTYWEMPARCSYSPIERWLAKYIQPGVWTERHQLLDDWLSQALDARTLELPARVGARL